MGKHTPGPWEDVWLDDENGWIMDSRGNYLAEMVVADEEGLCVSEDEARVNAHLMAAAPELLEACSLALDDFEMEGIELNHDTVTALKAAIKKARGGKP